ncbi:hypothetical protein ACQ4LE_010299 [Meloidogyne hapla]
MSSLINILILFIFTNLFIFKLINSDCIKSTELFPCDNNRNIPCCPNLYCRITFYKGAKGYRCSTKKCNNVGEGCLSDNACCYGTKCKGGKCQKCKKHFEYGCSNDGDCCTGSCSISDNQCY